MTKKKTSQSTIAPRLWLKGCPRCRGDVFKKTDLWGDYMGCVQCGHELSQIEERVLGFIAPDRMAVA